MLPGVHDNSELINVEYKKSPTSEFIVFTFENHVGEKLSHTEWKVMPRKNFETMTDKEKTLYLRLVNEQVARINKIATIYIPEEQFRTVAGNSFEEFCKNAITTLGNKYKGVKIRIKVVYDKRNFTALPTYLNYDWIEPMTISKEKSRVVVLKKDKMVKSVPEKTLEGANESKNEIEIAVNNKSEEPVFSLTKEEPVKDKDDLPF
jgi:hypothetical protein